MLTGAIEAIGNAIKSVSDSFTASKKRQSETAILKDRKNLQKAVDISEEIIEIIYKYLPLLTEDDSEKINGLIKKFRKYNWNKVNIFRF